ncbi:hypothetical protein ATE92_1122 [Ulvibacter sp. MAR_2010_11]|uniref:YqjF family protein n=1 Tax=Ulvibacter sp. MAR_2010_11 TaxID=1250229 RepID=UPI000C2C6F0B|nr:DUF2071 domain-containing protein [Ulvibacter sp. MAR_2010_11]PKA82978.1 hypothetical protein ATE92_1122 [Ulvibacter sp. MAR_2010_11]
MSFLNAEWRKLILVNYEVNPSVLKEYVPFGTELDLWNEKCYVSVVGFMFVNTKILGVKIPYHTTFEEVNLRFYVKRKVGDSWRRGVVFIKEIVPKPAITFIANLIYKENYRTLPMKHEWKELPTALEIAYRWRLDGGWQFIRVATEKDPLEIHENTEAEFITEHYWGYAKVSENKTNEYEVTHPRWLHYKVMDFSSHIDFTANYGIAFEFLSKHQPVSIYLAEGSPITVEPKNTF